MAGARERARELVVEEIKRVAREQIERDGAAALSLRAVARELDMVSSNIYRYVESRDALLTLLITEAYDAMGEAAEKALLSARRRSLEHRWEAVTRAVRDWALTHTGEYALVFGTPVPGYVAPEATVAPATRVTRVLASLLEEAAAAGGAAGAPRTVVGRDLRAVAVDYGLDLDDGMLAEGILAWTTLFGALSFELFGHYIGTVGAHPQAWFEEAMQRVGWRLGIGAPPRAARLATRE